MARRRGMGERQPGMQRHEASLRAGADQHEDQNERVVRGEGSLSRIALKAYCPSGPASRPKASSRRERAEARHDEIDVTRAQILRALDHAPSPAPRTRAT